MDTTERLTVHIKALTDAGYMVVKIPECNRTGGHGAHTLITRSARCEGKEPIPHSWANSHRGSFGFWNLCACGRSFADYAEDGPTPWEAHAKEHGIVTR